MLQSPPYIFSESSPCFFLKENPKGQTIFSIQKDMLLSKQLEAVKYTYETAENEMFSVNTI